MSSPISGFTAIPNPQMLAFMPIQSYLMMYFAGSGWQYGKRKISAMSNEQFNKLTPEELLRQHSIELKNMLPTLTKTLNDVTPLVKILILQYGDFIKEALAVIPQVVENVAGIEILTGQAKKDYDKAFFDAIKGLFPSIPDAEARLGTQGLEEAIAKIQAEITAQGKPETVTGIDLPVSPSITKPFQGPLVNPVTGETGFKPAEIKKLSTPTVAQRHRQFRKAGQSQILERNRLIKLITQWEKAKIGNTRTRVLAHHKQQLANLQARYRF